MEAKITLPDSTTLLREFAKRHQLEATDLLSREEVAVRATSVANLLVNRSYATLDDERLSDQAVGILLNMLHRNLSLVEAAIFCFVTDCGAAAEVSARTSVESSVNIAYILVGDAPSRMQAYFVHYFEDVDRQVEKWRASIGNLPKREESFHQQAISKRKLSNAALRDLMISLLGVARERWPKSIADRFKALGAENGYRTFYARMSSEVHADAEETIRYFIGSQAPREAFEAMALETVWTTRLYIYYAVSWFVKASIYYSLYYAFPDSVSTTLKSELGTVEKALAEIASNIGADFEAPEAPFPSSTP